MQNFSEEVQVDRKAQILEDQRAKVTYHRKKCDAEKQGDHKQREAQRKRESRKLEGLEATRQ